MADRRNLEAAAIQWHPAFCGAAELELRENKEDLEFQREYNLSKEPLRMDLLVVKKLSNVHARLFKALGRLGVKIERRYPGVYYIRRWKAMPATQIVVTRKLRGKTHRALKVLSKNAKKEDIKAFVETASRLTEAGDRNNVDAVMQASVAANKELYEDLRRCNPFMCEALRELMKDEIEEREQKAALEADQKARKEKSIELIRNLMETMKMTAEQAMAAMKIPDEDRQEYMAGL